jgi:hypothetical protein
MSHAYETDSAFGHPAINWWSYRESNPNLRSASALYYRCNIAPLNGRLGITNNRISSPN